METRSSPLYLELCPCLLCLCQRGPIPVLISHTEQQFQGIPVSSLSAGGPVFPVQAAQGSCTATASCSGANVRRPETPTNHLPAGTAKTWQVVSVFPPTQTGTCTLGFVLFDSFSCSSSLSTWPCISSLCSEGDENPVARRPLQSITKVHPAAALFMSSISMQNVIVSLEAVP